MKHKLVILALFCYLSNGAQTLYADSLRNLYTTAPKDSSKSIYLNLLSVYFLNNNLDSAKRYAALLYEDAIKRKNKKTRALARVYSYYGDIAAKEEKYAELIEYQSKALSLMQELGDTDGMIRTYIRLGNAYLLINDLDKAKVQAFNALNLLKNTPESIQHNTLSRGYNLAGEIQLKHKQFDSALYYFEKANKRAVNEKLIEWFVAKTFENKARAYIGLKQYDLAKQQFEKALNINTKISNYAAISTCREGLANLLQNANKIDSALLNLQTAERMAKQMNTIPALLTTYESYIELFHQQKKYQEESIYLRKKLKLNDSIAARRYGTELARAKIKFETHEKERENTLLANQSKMQQLELKETRNKMVVVCMASLLVLIGLIGVLRYTRLKNRERTLQLEQNVLRSQMNPHFIFNALIAIQSFIYKNESTMAGKYLSNFAKLMRSILEDSKEEFISLSTEINTLTYYLELQRLRFDNQFEFQIEVDPTLETDLIFLPPMLTQPFIENSIEHGFLGLERKGFISLKISAKNDCLEIHLNDNGVGLSNQEKQETHTSMATRITKERLALLQRKYKGSYRLEITEIKTSARQVQGVAVTFNIPFVTK